ncbi:haloacid dehalogenase [Rhodococcus sp. 05-2254-5]|uniref:HAD family hydrolase n=1 Tax=Nocardiaceae TaxID=85025 RepID=UPI00050BF462|nr:MULTISPECIES: HAD-IB family phosphatase [Rhodococcus]OZE39773.1 haloacid dehalogenase [Rhodococcus sp. 05-2254-5]OZE60908.1 haloacid dehalogenase [Rhodococcus sp. 05-2254-1]OZE97168.1 haloacid dehalogenase [Rhodococcus sp. 15-1154-1]OZE97820.1 haloacid dehalogenase [Rhodococcus sp. 15-2388-1-1a]
MTLRGMVFFDIDGTLVPSMSSGSFLAAHMGHQHELDDAERRYAVGELTNEQVSVIDARGWRGVDTSTVDRWLDDLPVIDGVDDVTSWCRSRRIEPVLASLAWQPVSSAIARRYGFTTNGGPQVGISESVYDGTVAEHFDEFDKRDRAVALAGERGIPLHRCCAIGDSRSDIPLFEVLPESLALNANTAAREAATAALDTRDLTALLPWLQQWEQHLD